jgi:hypothetical protein
MIPIEVKSGKSGTLRSLHSFIDTAPHAIGVRLNSDVFSIEKIQTIKGKAFTLINIPVYQTVLIEQYLDYIFSNVL